MADEGSELRTSYIALGGNLGDVKSSLNLAVERLLDEPIIRVDALSGLYRTRAVGGPAGQPDYLNAVVRIVTSLSARELLGRCLDVERSLGRIRVERWGPRTVDLDLLLHGDAIVDDPGLTVPHPRLRDRLFVLVPLADVAPPALPLPPDGEPLATALAAALANEGCSLGDFRKQSAAGRF
ncbi:MAG: 2-amino-4-hydroxy-6-hydroxymethyldihydropteridine diphosphokinase [Capsulimonadaceae bacterium]|nr:2-amino-4-hydroxy-6-hydroxymethyldihydropteridine diphosphokinase [Capsulimonadaceae bacterium]